MCIAEVLNIIARGARWGPWLVGEGGEGGSRAEHVNHRSAFAGHAGHAPRPNWRHKLSILEVGTSKERGPVAIDYTSKVQKLPKRLPELSQSTRRPPPDSGGCFQVPRGREVVLTSIQAHAR